MRKKRGKAKKKYKSKYIRGKPRSVMVALHKCKDDDISPGIIRAVAEWRVN